MYLSVYNTRSIFFYVFLSLPLFVKLIFLHRICTNFVSNIIQYRITSNEILNMVNRCWIQYDTDESNFTSTKSFVEWLIVTSIYLITYAVQIIVSRRTYNNNNNNIFGEKRYLRWLLNLRLKTSPLSLRNVARHVRVRIVWIDVPLRKA